MNHNPKEITAAVRLLFSTRDRALAIRRITALAHLLHQTADDLAVDNEVFNIMEAFSPGMKLSALRLITAMMIEDPVAFEQALNQVQSTAHRLKDQ